MLVSSPENFERARSLGFPVLAMKSRHRKKAERVAPGDRVVFYATGVMAFAGTFTVTGPYYESHEPLFQSKKDGEDYPFRFAVRPDVVLPAAAFVSAQAMLPRLEFTSKWPADHWHLAFQGNVHTLGETDFATIEGALQAAAAPVAV
jgi:hypothetical protein